MEVAAPQDFGEQAQLAAGATAFALDARGRQRGFAADDGDEVSAQGIEFAGDGIEEFRTAAGRQLPVARVGAGGGFGGGIHFFRGGLHETVRQRLAAGGVETLQEERAGRAAGAADVVVSEDGCHVDLMQGKPRRGWPAGPEPRAPQE